MSDAPQSRNGNKNNVMIAVALTIVVGLPSTINQIANPIIRTFVCLVALIVVLGAGVFIQPRQGRGKTRDEDGSTPVNGVNLRK